MLSNENWLSISLQFRQQFGGPTLQCGNEFCTHESDTKVSLADMQDLKPNVANHARASSHVAWSNLLGLPLIDTSASGARRHCLQFESCKQPLTLVVLNDLYARGYLKRDHGGMKH